jgi:hypothetical protein
VPVNSTHVDYEAAALNWSRARDVLAGEDAVKAGGEKYLARLDSQTDEESAAYRKRSSFFNATARTAEAYLGLIFRRPPFVKLPSESAGVGRALAEFQNDADMLGTSLTGYAKVVVGDVVGLGRAGSLVDWESGGATGQGAERRAYAVF